MAFIGFLSLLFHSFIFYLYCVAAYKCIDRSFIDDRKCGKNFKDIFNLCFIIKYAY